MKRLFLLALCTIVPLRAFSEPSHPCEAQIERSVCEVAQPEKESGRYKDDRACLSTDTRRYQNLIKTAFSTYPPFVQNQFCSLKRIYIEQDFFGTAWSAPVNENTPNEILIGLRKKDLDTGITLQAYQSWFEQQSFGGKPDFQVDPALPWVEVKPRSISKLPFVAFTLLHEIGHSFDYQRHFNRSKADPQFSGSWTSIQWEDIGKIRPEFDFKNRKQICLNNCNGKFLDPQTASSLYKNLHSHGFISQLSSVNAMEDFADSFAYFVMSRITGADLAVKTTDGNSFSSSSFIQSREFKNKLRYLNREFDSK